MDYYDDNDYFEGEDIHGDFNVYSSKPRNKKTKDSVYSSKHIRVAGANKEKSKKNNMTLQR